MNCPSFGASSRAICRLSVLAPEMPSLVKLYEKDIPYYHIRHLIKPGLSGWAQIYHHTPPKFDAGHDETKTKLSYDLYYIKNHSLLLDFKIILKTLKALLLKRV